MNHIGRTTCVLLLGLFGGLACRNGDGPPTDAGPLLAEVYDQQLYLSELDGMVPQGIGREDSTLIVRAYVERWVRDAVLMHEAARSVPADLDLDRLVADYRASLIRHNYEQLLVAQLSDTAVDERLVREYYAANQFQFELEVPIVKGRLLKLPNDAPESEQLDRWWNSGADKSDPAFRRYAQRYAVLAYLDRNAWVKGDRVVTALPPGTLSLDQLQRGTEVDRRDEAFRYLLRIDEVVPARRTAPYDYVREQVRTTLLHQRQNKLLEARKEDMYQRALRQNDVRIY